MSVILWYIYMLWLILYLLLLFLDYMCSYMGMIGCMKSMDLVGIYECGFWSYYNMLCIDSFNKSYFIRYYMVCMMYLMFDIELMYVYPLCLYMSKETEVFSNMYNIEIMMVMVLVILFMGLLVEMEGV